MASLQGLLTGPYRSLVQIKALMLKQYLDVIAEASSSRAKRTEALKLAMGSSGNWTFESLFPEAFGKEAFTVQKPPSESSVEPSEEMVTTETKWSDTTSLDYSAVEWMSPQDSKDQVDALMRKVASMSHGTMNGNQIRPKFPLEGQWR